MSFALARLVIAIMKEFERAAPLIRSPVSCGRVTDYV